MEALPSAKGEERTAPSCRAAPAASRGMPRRRSANWRGSRMRLSRGSRRSMAHKLRRPPGRRDGALYRRLVTNSPRVLPARRRLADDDQAAVFLADVAAGREVGKDAADHLARGADARGDVAVRERLVDAQAPPPRLRGGEQPAPP